MAHQDKDNLNRAVPLVVNLPVVVARRPDYPCLVLPVVVVPVVRPTQPDSHSQHPTSAAVSLLVPVHPVRPMQMRCAA